MSAPIDGKAIAKIRSENMKILNRWAALATLSVFAGGADAALVFSGVHVTAHSVTFSVDGDLQGYAAPVSWAADQFGIVYSADLWKGPRSFSGNTWSRGVFDNRSLGYGGVTGYFDDGSRYSWSYYKGGSLLGASAKNRTVTVDFGLDFLDPAAHGTLTFVWGSGDHPSLHTALQEVRIGNEPSVPEPATFTLVSLGALALGLSRRRK